MTREKETIVKVGNPVLRQKAQEVKPADIKSPKIKKIIETMSETLRKTEDGVGIAAPQIGVPLRIFIASEEAKYTESNPKKCEKKDKNSWKHYIFINPEIIKTSQNKIESQEGCLSVPGLIGLVPRAEKVKIEALDEKGKKIKLGTSKLFARLMQHEMDHLEGVLFVDRSEKVIKIEHE
ncbi:peptide deformylase [Patescibacteria group bacterium]